MRRNFQLPAADERWLDAAGRPWETVIEGQARWLVIHEFQVPDGYAVVRVSVALSIPATYPDTQIDMVYFRPALERRDGRAIHSPAMQTILGEPWQRWSRHRTAENPWRTGEDDVSTHMALVLDWLRKELGR